MTKFNEQDYFLFDGAMGTYYSAKHDKNIACELANLTDSVAIYNIHKEYIKAGANAIKTNTFGANRFTLKCEQQEVEKVIEEGWIIAMQAAEDQDVMVFADIGPISESIANDLESEYKSIIDIFIKCGAQNFLFETFSKYNILLQLAAYIRLNKPEALIVASFAVYPDGYSKDGIYYKDIVDKVRSSRLVDAFGLNCISGPAHMCKLVSNLSNTKNISIMPNSGYPSYERGRAVYTDNSEYFAQKLLELRNMGIRILGGCCGTTPNHIAAAKSLLENSEDYLTKDGIEADTEQLLPKKSNIINKFIAEKKPILVEIDPPFDIDWEYMLKDALLLKQAGADLITISDSPLAKARADSTMLAAKIQREAGIPVMPHITCRDKNLLGIKAALLGLHIEGIRNILAVTGDPIASAERKDIKGVFSTNSSNLANYISSLNANVFKNDEIYIGGALNINAANFQAELKRSQIKIDNGISYFLTQAIYTDTAVNNVIEAVKVLRVPIFAGIMPLVGYRNAQFINNEVPGIKIDEHVIEQFKDRSREESELIGINLSMLSIDKLYGYVSGFYLMTPLKRTHVICELVKRIKKINI